MNMTRDTGNAIASQSMLANTALGHVPDRLVQRDGSFLISILPSDFELRIFRVTDGDVDMDMWHSVPPSTCWRNIE